MPADLFLACRVGSGTQQVAEKVSQLLRSTQVRAVTLNLEPETSVHAAALKIYSEIDRVNILRHHEGAGLGDYR